MRTKKRGVERRGEERKGKGRRPPLATAEGGRGADPPHQDMLRYFFRSFLLSISSCIIAETDRDHRSSGDSDHLAGQQRLPLFKKRIERERLLLEYNVRQ